MPSWPAQPFLARVHHPSHTLIRPSKFKIWKCEPQRFHQTRRGEGRGDAIPFNKSWAKNQGKVGGWSSESNPGQPGYISTRLLASEPTQKTLRSCHSLNSRPRVHPTSLPHIRSTIWPGEKKSKTHHHARLGMASPGYIPTFYLTSEPTLSPFLTFTPTLASSPSGYDPASH